MHDQSKEYIETRDLYLEMLQKAQKYEDQKLINMIHQRLKQYSPTFITKDGCQVIYFPCTNMPFSVPENKSEFWKDPSFWPELLQFLGMLSFSLSAIFYFIITALS